MPSYVDERGEPVHVASELGDVGAGVVGLAPCGAWALFEIVRFDGALVELRERADWGDPSG